MINRSIFMLTAWKKAGSVLLSLLFLFSVHESMARGEANSARPTLERMPAIDSRYFIENKGQWPDDVLYLTRIKGMNAWITRQGVVYDFYQMDVHPVPQKSGEPNHSKTIPEGRVYGQIVRQTYEGMSVSEVFGEGRSRLPGCHSYFIGNNPAKWASGVRLFQEVLVKQVYQGIDIRYYFDGEHLRSDYVVAPGANPRKIRFNFEGASVSATPKGGDLRIGVCLGELGLGDLFVYQGTKENQIPARFMQDGESWSIQIAPFQAEKELIIDPLLYGTFLGGSMADLGYDVSVDDTGNAYLTGQTGSATFPLSVGAYQSNLQGGYYDLYVTKVQTNSSVLQYSTFIGGNGNDAGYGIVVDAAGNAYIAGTTWSNNYPVTAACIQAAAGGGSTDALITKLNSTGTALLYSTYLGGNAEDFANDIAMDPVGGFSDVYVVGVTHSLNFPVTAACLQGNHAGTNDAFVAKLNPAGTALEFSTFLGGVGIDIGFALAVDASLNVYVAGNSSSFNFPTTVGCVQSTPGGNLDAFVCKLNAFGNVLQYSTLLGGQSVDAAQGIVLDPMANATVVGYTRSANFPVTGNCLQSSNAGGDDMFICKLNFTGSALVYSTYLGGSADDYADDLALDQVGYVYLCGHSASPNFPVTAAADQAANSGNTDVVVAKLNILGSALLYSSYYGGAQGDYVEGIDCDQVGNLYLTGWTSSANFPVTIGSIQDTLSLGSDAFLMKLGLNTFTSVEEIRQNALGLYPNPSHGFIHLRLPEEVETSDVTVFDMAGREVFQEKGFRTIGGAIDLSGLSKGVYTVRAADGPLSWLGKLVIH